MGCLACKTKAWIRSALERIRVLKPIPPPKKEPTQLFQLRASGRGLSVRSDVIRVDNVVYSSIEQANAEMPRFLRDVTSLRPCRSDAIALESCRIEVFAMPLDTRDISDKHHEWA